MSRKAIDLRRTDPGYAEREQRNETEAAKRTLMYGALGVGIIGVLGNLALKTASLFAPGRRMI